MYLRNFSLGGAFGEAYVARAPEGVGSGGGEPAGATTSPSSGTSNVGATPSESSASGVSPSPSAPTSPATSSGEPVPVGSVSGAGATETPAFDMFNGFFDEPDLGLSESEVAPATPPKTGEPGKPPGPGGVEPPAPLPPSPALPPLAAAAATPGPGVETPSAASQSPSLPLHDPGALSDFIRQNSSVLEPQIAEQLFKLSPEDVKALEEDFVGSVPRLQARVFLQIQTAVLGQIAKMVPAMYEHMNARTQAGQSLENEFLEQFPGLKRAEHGPLIKTTASALKQIDPKMSKADLFAKTGAIVMSLAGVAPGAQPPASSPPAAPARVPMSPFTPAPSGAGAGRNSHTVAVNEWSGLDPASQA